MGIRFLEMKNEQYLRRRERIYEAACAQPDLFSVVSPTENQSLSGVLASADLAIGDQLWHKGRIKEDPSVVSFFKNRSRAPSLSLLGDSAATLAELERESGVPLTVQVVEIDSDLEVATLAVIRPNRTRKTK